MTTSMTGGGNRRTDRPAAAALPDPAIEEALRRAAAGDPPDDLSVTYSDMHGLWGGLTIAVSPGGWERAERRRGEAAPALERGPLTAGSLADIAALLLEIRAWEKRGPDVPPVAGESRATLIVHCGAGSSEVWERVNDLAAGRRLSRVRDGLLRLATQS